MKKEIENNQNQSIVQDEIDELNNQERIILVSERRPPFGSNEDRTWTRTTVKIMTSSKSEYGPRSPTRLSGLCTKTNLKFLVLVLSLSQKIGKVVSSSSSFFGKIHPRPVTVRSVKRDKNS